MPKKTITISILLFLLFSTLLFIKTEITLAAPETFDPQVNIGVTDLNVDGGLMGRYIEGIYKYSIGFVGILAAVVLMFGGFLWIAAAGNGERVANAKAWIQAALSGLILALCSYTILWYVNPDLVKFESITIKEAEKGDSADADKINSCALGTKIVDPTTEAIATCAGYCGSGGYENLFYIDEKNHIRCCVCKIGAPGDVCGTKNNCESGLVCTAGVCT